MGAGKGWQRNYVPRHNIKHQGWQGPYKGKEIKFANTGRVENAGGLADEFMFDIFDFDAGEYLITDESSISDFTEFGSSDTARIWKRIQLHYDLKPDEIGSDKLVDIFEEILARRKPH